MEAYRRGHNEPHSKCGCPQGHVGSNPTASAKGNIVNKWYKDPLNILFDVNLMVRDKAVNGFNGVKKDDS